MENKTICNGCGEEKLNSKFPQKHGKRNDKTCLLCLRIQKNKDKTRACKTCDLKLDMESFRIGENIIDRNHNCINCYNKDEKKCSDCGEVKSYSDFDLPTGQKCIKCKKQTKKEAAVSYREKNIEKISTYAKIYYLENSNIIIERAAENYQLNKKERNQKQYLRKKNDPILFLRQRISGAVLEMLKSNNGSKAGKSILEFLPFDNIMQLKIHIEEQFLLPENLDYDGKVWMTWDNHGAYKKSKWNDKDSSTWVWQLDHIKPHSKLPYDS